MLLVTNVQQCVQIATALAELQLEATVAEALFIQAKLAARYSLLAPVSVLAVNPDSTRQGVDVEVVKVLQPHREVREQVLPAVEQRRDALSGAQLRLRLPVHQDAGHFHQ